VAHGDVPIMLYAAIGATASAAILARRVGIDRRALTMAAVALPESATA
jgi:hypothetical protein